jgi:hypothetical protein
VHARHQNCHSALATLITVVPRLASDVCACGIDEGAGSCGQ